MHARAMHVGMAGLGTLQYRLPGKMGLVIGEKRRGELTLAPLKKRDSVKTCTCVHACVCACTYVRVYVRLLR